jgi:hypothetical protein
MGLQAGFFKVDLATKKYLLEVLGLEQKFIQAFDLVLIPGMKIDELTTVTISASLDNLILVELKTTKKHLPENPKGFFFGATQNEIEFGNLLGSRFRFCFVSLHSKASTYALLTLPEMEKLIKIKRIQYQINL